jgi:acyl-coenzyme A synthetase/AMP-(fatty) acid ligase
MLWRFDRYQTNVAVEDEHGQRLTYAELRHEGRMLCQQADGRCLVFCLCRNVMGSFVGYVSFLNGGVVPVMLPADMDPALLRSLYETYRPKYVWGPAEFELEDDCCRHERFGYRLLQTPFGDSARMAPDLALLLTTSGSTGSPKLVRQSYRNIRANMDSIVEYLHIMPDDRPVTTLPMHYTYGLSIINTHLDVGATILLTDRGVAQKAFWTFFRDQGATGFGGVPYTYEMLDRMRFTRMNLPSLRVMTQAGGKLSPELHQKFAEWCRNTGREFIVMYGQCEATARMAYLPWEKSLEKIGSVGVPIPGGAFELIGEDGDPIAEPHVTGELRYRGGNVTLGYAVTADDLMKEDERHGVLDTGDMAQVDEDGFYTIVGRKNRFLKIFGNRVNLDEAERMLKAKFPNADCACGGRDDHLSVFGTDEAALPEMRAYLAEKTGLNPGGFFIKAVPAIPKNEAGKTLYLELEKYDD